MNLWLPILVLALATGFGFWWRSKQGKFKNAKASGTYISKAELGIDLASRVTIVQFSSAFCSPCKATAAIITNLTKEISDVAYIQIKSEERLDLIEKFKIQSTPTVVLFDKSGLEVGRAVGTPTKEQVLASIAAVR